MVIKELLEDYKADLMEPLMVLSKLLDVDKSYIYTHIDRELSEAVVDKFKSIMDKLEAGQPIQYLLGEREFMGLNFFVKEGVLIPRNDTETLVEYIIDYAGDKKIDILEIGYGSGAIALSLGHYLKEAQIVGVDISDQAYEVAQINKERFGLSNVELLRGDLFSPIGDRKFDIIVSNPPYIRKEVIEKLDRKVRDFEPILALDGGEDGLSFYRRITSESGDFLKAGGLLAYEIGYDQGQEVSNILIENAFREVEIIRDLAGQDRVVLGKIRGR